MKSSEAGYTNEADTRIVRLLAGPFTVTTALSPAAGSEVTLGVRVKVAGVIALLRLAASQFWPEVVATLTVTGTGPPLLVTAIVRGAGGAPE
jgi:hypothetical protein